MKISEMKHALAGLEAVSFRLPDGTQLPAHFHVTEVGLVSKHFIDCGGVERRETVANFQLWEAGDYDHRLAPQKFLHILQLSEKILGPDDLDIEVEYQQATIGKFGLHFDGTDFQLTTKQTACLAQDACGIPAAEPFALPQLQMAGAACTPGGGCC
ncbi:DUF6428 family protein [Hymenobacter sp. APR13]|uniref:DUF6428 family protein n=1 Tax=Hymenobacter sp. APR13 TaxID=1356852 RepID=UPI0004E099B7|nr:DUF6428 family protein [Hymenobacter sp. APR13]AII51612.1 hypothetical protein N008_06400 [Hymenobacter sp. APR13]